MKANEPARRPGLPSYLNGVIAGDYASYDFNANASAKQLRASAFVQPLLQAVIDTDALRS